MALISFNNVHAINIISCLTYYSVLKLFTGFANAALIAWKLTVISAISNAIDPATANTHHPILIL